MGEFDWATLIAGALTAGATVFGFIFAGQSLQQSADQHRAAEKWPGQPEGLRAAAAAAIADLRDAPAYARDRPAGVTIRLAMRFENMRRTPGLRR